MLNQKSAETEGNEEIEERKEGNEKNLQFQTTTVNEKKGNNTENKESLSKN